MLIIRTESWQMVLPFYSYVDICLLTHTHIAYVECPHLLSGAFVFMLSLKMLEAISPTFCWGNISWPRARFSPSRYVDATKLDRTQGSLALLLEELGARLVPFFHHFRMVILTVGGTHALSRVLMISMDKLNCFILLEGTNWSAQILVMSRPQLWRSGIPATREPLEHQLVLWFWHSSSLTSLCVMKPLSVC